MTGKGFWICCAPWIKYVSMFDYSFIGITACAQTEFLSTWIYLLSDMRPAYCQFTIYKKHFLQKTPKISVDFYFFSSIKFCMAKQRIVR